MKSKVICVLMASCISWLLASCNKSVFPVFGDGYVRMKSGYFQNNILKMNDTTYNYFFFARHAEKDSLGNLNQWGIERASRLPTIFKQIRFDRVFSTDVSRTKATAQPVCTAQNLALELYKKDNQTALLRELMQRRGQKILIIGHSNTVPALLNFLKSPSQATFSDLKDNEYNKLFYVRCKAVGTSDIEIFEY